MVNTGKPAPPPRRTRWVTLTFGIALGVFTALTVRDAGRPAVRPVAGGTFTGRDVDGRLVQVCLFEQDDGWQGWLYREGREQTEWFSTTNRVHPWQAVVNVREREDVPKLPEPVVASTEDSLRLNATLPRTNGWASDTANLTRQFGHVSFRRRAGVRIGRMGGTREFVAQFPRLPETNGFIGEVNRAIIAQCESAAAEFNSEAFSFWRQMIAQRELDTGFNEHTLEANWQLRLLTRNLASFFVSNEDVTGGSGNHSRQRGANFIELPGALRALRLGDLFRSTMSWEKELRLRCAPKAKAAGAPDYELLLDPDSGVEVDTFTLSPAGLQIYFNPYILGSGADGAFVVHFDYAELKDLLRTDGPAALLPRGP